MIIRRRPRGLLLLVVLSCLVPRQFAHAEVRPVLKTLFPAGGRTGATVEVEAVGSAGGFQTLVSNIRGLTCERLDERRFRLSIPQQTRPGSYDVWGVASSGITEPRTFVVSDRTELTATEAPESETGATAVPLDVVLNGVIDKPADADFFRFSARRGQRVIVECQAERIDSRLRAVLEVFDASGKRLGVNRGFFGIDPLIDFIAPADGSYMVKIQDLTASGGAEHIYRLEIDTGPRVAFAVPSVVQRGHASRITLYGWNLSSSSQTETEPAAGGESGGMSWSQIEIELPAESAIPEWPVPIRLQPAQAVLAEACFAYHLPGSHATIPLELTDLPVVRDHDDNHSPETAREIAIPSVVSGQLAEGTEVDWYRFSARSGEIVYFEALGQRLGAPVDLQISVCDVTGEHELAAFGDEVRNLGGPFSTSHVDPEGRWLCPADGMYRVSIRNLVGGQRSDPRRLYRLSARRSEPDFQLLAVSPGAAPTALNVSRGGSATLEILALRRRGFEDEICITAAGLPTGVDCPDVWLGPGVERTTLVVSAESGAETGTGNLTLAGTGGSGLEKFRRVVSGGTIVRDGTPTGQGRLVSRIPIAVSDDAPVQLTASTGEPLQHPLYGQIRVRHAAGGVLDVAVSVKRRDPQHTAPVRLSGVGLPEMLHNQTSVIPAGRQTGHLSFELPRGLAEGHYSLVIRAETTVPAGDGKTTAIMVHSPPVTFVVERSGMFVDVAPATVTHARRGETLQVSYTVKRLNGFIGKLHTELAVPGLVTDIPGVRGRGETFTGQTEQGSLQIMVNDDAPLGAVQFLRLFTVGVLEDEPTYFGSRMLPLEIVE